MSHQTTRKTFLEHLEEGRAAFAAAGFRELPADHPVYRQGGYMIHSTSPTDASPKSSPTRKSSPLPLLNNYLTSLTTSKPEKRGGEHMSNQPNCKPFSESLAEGRAAAERAGFKEAPADHPVYRQQEYLIRPVGPLLPLVQEREVPTPGPCRPKESPLGSVLDWLITTPLGTRDVKLYEHEEDGITSYFVTDSFGGVITTDTSGRAAETLSFEYAEAVFAAAANVDSDEVPCPDHLIETRIFNEEYPAGLEIEEPLPEGFKTDEFLWIVEEVALEDLTFFGMKKTSSSPDEWTVRLLHNPDSWYYSQEGLIYHALERYEKKLSSD